MKKLLIIIMIFTSFTVFAADKKTSLLNTLAAVNTFSADFDQINNLKDFGDDVYAGSVYIKMKEKALWDYKEPYKSWYLVTKDVVDYYDEINNQLVKMDAKELKEHALLQVLMDFQKLKSTFNVTEKKDMLVLKPKTNTGIIYINIVFKDGIISELQSKDNTGNTTSITFSKVKIDKNISDSTFKKKVPKDVTVINESN